VWVAYGAFFWLVFDAALIFMAISRTSSLRFGPERRSSVRFDAGLDGTLDGIACRISDISLTGAEVSMAQALEERPAHGLTVGVLGQAISVGVELRWQRPRDDGSVLLGLEFRDGQTKQQAALALSLLNRQAVLAGRTQKLAA